MINKKNIKIKVSKMDTGTYFDFIPTELVIVIINSSDDYTSIRNLVKFLRIYIDYEQLISLKYPVLYSHIKKVSTSMNIESRYEYNVLYKDLLTDGYDDNLDGYIRLVSMAEIDHETITADFLSMIWLYVNFTNEFKYIRQFPRDELMYYYIQSDLYEIRSDIPSEKYFLELLIGTNKEIDTQNFIEYFDDIEIGWAFMLIIVIKYKIEEHELKDFVKDEAMRFSSTDNLIFSPSDIDERLTYDLKIGEQIIDILDN